MRITREGELLTVEVHDDGAGGGAESVGWADDDPSEDAVWELSACVS